MPEDEDYLFGNEAVRRGLVTQAQLEECVETLCALERVGSRKRLWDLLEKKGYMSGEQVAQLRREQSLGLGEPATPPDSEQQAGSEAGVELDVAPPRPEPEGSLEAMVTIAGPAPGKGDSDINWQMPGQVEFRDGDSSLDFLPKEGEPHADGEPPAEAEPAAEVPERIYRPGALQLICVEGPAEGKEFPLTKPTNTIGRDTAAEISIRDLSVSRQHAAVLINDDAVEVRDLGSRNGVHVGGQRVDHAPLKLGDQFSVGKSVFMLDRLAGGSG